MKYLKCAIAGILISSFTAAYAMEIDFSESTGFGLDADRVQIKHIRVDTPVTNPFDPSRPQIYSVYYDVPFIFDTATLHLVPNLGGAQQTDDPNRVCANLSVLVNSAFTGEVLPNASVAVNGINAVTDTEGMVSFSNLVAGETTVSAAIVNFVSENSVKNLACGANNVTLALNPASGSAGAVEANQVRVVLTWGTDPSDLDSHLTGPAPDLSESSRNEAGRFHVYFSDDVADVASLDVDDTDSFGPETITISPPTGASSLRSGVYRYSIHHYAGATTMESAVVKLYLGNSPPRTFTPDALGLNGDNDLWTVFELTVDNAGRIGVLPVNAYSSDVAPASSVRSGSRHYGAEESRNLLDLSK